MCIRDRIDAIRGLKNDKRDWADIRLMQEMCAGEPYSVLRLAIGSKGKTLTSAEIEEVASGVLNKIAKRFGAELRR